MTAARAFAAGAAVIAAGLLAPQPARAAPDRRHAAADRPRAGADRPHAAEDEGRVQFVTDRRVYLDRGASDGLAAGQAVALLRNGHPPRRCVVEIADEHTAVCRASGARPDDLFHLHAARRPPRATTSAVATLPPLVDEPTLQARAAALAAAPHDKVDFVPLRTEARPSSLTVAAGVTLWSAPAGAPETAEELDVQLRRLRLGETDLRLDAALSVVTWQRRAAALRFRPDRATQVYLWQAEVSRRELDDRVVFAAGRIWPWHIPGVAALDGLQLGRRSASGSAEAGAYAGTLPAPASLAPTVDAWAGGLYGALAQSGGKGDLFRFAREEARLGLRESPVVGLVRELEALADVSRAAFGADAAARVRYAPRVDRGPALEQAWLGMRVGAAGAPGALLQLRYVGVAPEQQPLLVDETPALRGGYHATLSASVAPHPALELGVAGSAHADLDSGTREADAAFELRLPRLFGGAGGLWVGASAAEGWLRSRSAYLQLLGRDEPRLRVIARLAVTTDAFTTPTTAADLSELGGNLLIELRASARLRLRAHGLLRLPLQIQGQPPDGTAGVAVVSGVDAIVVL
jgi:hypothetical protein